MYSDPQVSLILLNAVSLVCCLVFMLLLACSKHNLTFRNWRTIKKTELARHYSAASSGGR